MSSSHTMFRFILPDSPAKAKFLNKEEKAIAVERLRANNMVRRLSTDIILSPNRGRVGN